MATSSGELIIAGDRDQYTRTEPFIEIYRSLRDAQLSLIPGCGRVAESRKTTSNGKTASLPRVDMRSHASEHALPLDPPVPMERQVEGDSKS